MANTYSQIYIQTVFAVDGRLSLIHAEFKEQLSKYMTGIVRNKRQKLIAINGMSDHVHILIGLKPAMALADLVRDIKPIRQISSTARNGCVEDSRGKRAMARFLMGIHTRHRHPLHSKSRTTSSTANVQGRIRDVAEEV